MEIISQQASRDNKTTKYLQKTIDDQVIETGYYNLDEHIICISSQIGCNMGCVFCENSLSNGNAAGFVRNLNYDEIIAQVENIIQDTELGKDNKKILFSFMGIGEPLLNYESVTQSIRKLVKQYQNSRVTISTIGSDLIRIKDLAGEPLDTELKLHLSLHAPNDELRKGLIPMAYEITPSLEVLKSFSEKKNAKSKVNYSLIENVNDDEGCARELAKLLKPFDFCVKLSRLNTLGKYKSSDETKFEMFENILNNAGTETCRFISTGTDIKAGCGQLRSYYYS